ncbi:MAG TPA: hypothetical protein VM260_21770 [Pirellula sp.]|nr:hypothetical protein [Pirellula sp.]
MNQNRRDLCYRQGLVFFTYKLAMKVKKMGKSVGLAMVFVVFGTLLGCGGESLPKRVPVEGTVLYKQKPLAGATVSFKCDNAPRVASGITDDQGKFKLTMYEPNDGAIPGDHKITVIKLDTSNVVKGEMSASDPGEAYSKAMAQAATGPRGGAKDELPTIYGEFDKTPLKETVSATGPNVFTLQLK